MKFSKPIIKLTSVTAMLTLLMLSQPLSADDTYRSRIQQWLSSQGYEMAFEAQQVNIFGDGDNSNGIEDNRIDMSSSQWNSVNRRPWNMGSGTIHCDGRNRGSAVIVDTSDMGELEKGAIIATSAHVLFDLEKMRLFSSCKFHYMALDHLPGYQTKIELSLSRMGRFDPSSPRNNKGFGKEDWAFLYIDDDMPGISLHGGLPLRAFEESPVQSPDADSYQFIAYSHSVDAITISTVCQVTRSVAHDIGGGAWSGQLLDNCDSEGGASGGGLVASHLNKHYLVGIRSGSHWDGEMFPASEFPFGPPEGAQWDVMKNTNFGRAIDIELINELRAMVKELNLAIDSI